MVRSYCFSNSDHDDSIRDILSQTVSLKYVNEAEK